MTLNVITYPFYLTPGSLITSNWNTQSVIFDQPRPSDLRCPKCFLRDSISVDFDFAAYSKEIGEECPICADTEILPIPFKDLGF